MSTYGNFNDYIRKKDYKKIHKLLLKMNNEKPSFNNIINIEHYKVVEKKKQVLKMIIKNDIQFMLINRKNISNELLMVIQLLDNDFNNDIRSNISHSVIKRALDEIQKSLDENDSLKIINHWISMYNTKIQELKFKNSHLPPSWNLTGEFTYNFSMYFKKYLMIALQQRNSNIEIIKALQTILDFEEKVLKFSFVTYCCTEKKNTHITFQNNEVVVGENDKKNEIVIYSGSVLCTHKKLLSQCFVNYLDVYMQHLFSDISRLEFNSTRIEMKIFTTFIDFFKNLNNIFLRLIHFENCDILCKLVASADGKLCLLITRMPKSKSLYIASVALNSLMYVETTFNNFLDTIYKTTKTDFTNLQYSEQLRNKEKMEYSYIDGILYSSFSNIKTIRNPHLGDYVYKLIQQFVFIEDYYEFYDEVTYFLIENIISVLFSFIIREKMDQSLAENVLAEITDLKRLILARLDKIPFLNIIECYLKIFLVDPHSTQDFVENFKNFGHDNFNFLQILKMLKDDTNNIKLFMTYKKISDEQKHIII